MDLDVCPHCEGEGGIFDDGEYIDGRMEGGGMTTCHVCEGEGLVDTSPCIICSAPVYDHEEDCPAAGPCRTCGMGSGSHAVDCPHVAPARQEEVRR